MDLVDYPNALVDFPVCCADKYEAGLLDVEELRYGENNKKSLRLKLFLHRAEGRDCALMTLTYYKNYEMS